MELVANGVTKREQMILLLKKARWYEGRSIDISEFEAKCEEQGIEIFDSARKFLKEFMNIEAHVYYSTMHPCDDIGISDSDYEFFFITEPYNKIYSNNDYKKILNFAQEDCFYLGHSGYHYSAIVAIGRSGNLYFKHDYTKKVLVFDTLIDSMLWELRDMNIVTNSLYDINDEQEKHYKVFHENYTYIAENYIIDFERIYWFDDKKFTSETYEELQVMYESLPFYIESPKFLPIWYGDEEKGDTYFISLSYEFPGFKFHGKLPISAFYQWEYTFHKLMKNFPFIKQYKKNN